MSKYDPLWRYIQRSEEAEMILSFEEINEVLGFKIDHSFLNYKKELEEYGYRVEKIYLKEKRLKIVRLI